MTDGELERKRNIKFSQALGTERIMAYQPSVVDTKSRTAIEDMSESYEETNHGTRTTFIPFLDSYSTGRSWHEYPQGLWRLKSTTTMYTQRRHQPSILIKQCPLKLCTTSSSTGVYGCSLETLDQPTQFTPNNRANDCRKIASTSEAKVHAGDLLGRSARYAGVYTVGELCGNIRIHDRVDIWIRRRVPQDDTTLRERFRILCV